MKWLWKVVASIVTTPIITSYLIRVAQRTPYFHLEGYMNRWWLFNGYSEVGRGVIIPKLFPSLPSIRIHHILRADTARDPHDHPWDARTIILKGGYTERRLIGDAKKVFCRWRGDTATLKYGEYHSIDEVSAGGVWTMFITYRYRGPWGFLVDGKKIPWQYYEEQALLLNEDETMPRQDHV